MSDDFIVFGRPDIQQAEIDEVIATMESTWLGTGPKVKLFEESFAQYQKLEPGYSAAVNSCTAALHVSLLSSDLGPGDEVITTAMTFCATINAIIHTGATPVLADIEPNSFNVSADQIRARITKNTKAILIVHFAGRPCNMDEMVSLAADYNLKLIEDCAHAIETRWHGKASGTFGDFGCFSFYVTKNIVTGEGGMVLAKTEEDIARIKMLTLHGMSKDAWNRFGSGGYKHYQVVEAGYKYNMMDLQAAIGIHQLKRIDESWSRREKIWQHYQTEFADLPLQLPLEPAENTRHGYHLYTINVDEKRCGVLRDDFLNQLTQINIGAGVHYISIPAHQYYAERFGWRVEDYPNAKFFGETTVSLPLSAALSDQEVDRVVSGVKKLLQ